MGGGGGGQCVGGGRRGAMFTKGIVASRPIYQESLTLPPPLSPSLSQAPHHCLPLYPRPTTTTPRPFHPLRLSLFLPSPFVSLPPLFLNFSCPLLSFSQPLLLRSLSHPASHFHTLTLLFFVCFSFSFIILFSPFFTYSVVSKD